MEAKSGEIEPKKSKKPVRRFGALAVETDQHRGKSERRGQHAESLHQTPGAPEHIGHMLVAANERVRHAPEKRSKGAESARHEAVITKRVATMNRAELLALSEQLTVDGTSLSQIYETHLIGERGLRRLIAEYQRGGDLHQALRREILEREIDFERDPALRDMSPFDDNGVQAPSGKVALEHLLETAAQVIAEDSDEVAFYKANATYQELQRDKQHRTRRLLDLSLGGIIALLIALVIVLLLTRH